MPAAKAKSENTPTVASSARNPRIYGSALPRPSTTKPVAAATKTPATSKTRTILPPRAPPALRSTALRAMAIESWVVIVLPSCPAARLNGISRALYAAGAQEALKGRSQRPRPVHQPAEAHAVADDFGHGAIMFLRNFL